MNNNLKKQLKLYQIIIILYFICHGSLCGIGSKTIFSLAYEDAWIIPIVIAIIGLIPFSITLYIVEKYPNKNIFEIIEYQFGKIIGKIIVMQINRCFDINTVIPEIDQRNNLFKVQHLRVK